MNSIVPLVFLNVSVGLLVAGLSWRLSRLRPDGAYMRYWALYWAMASLSFAVGSRMAPNTGSSAPTTVYALAAIFVLLGLRPALMSMAAASLVPKLSSRTVWWIGAAAFFASIASMVGARALQGAPFSEKSPAPLFMINATATFAFALAYYRGRNRHELIGLFTTSSVLAYAGHLAVLGYNPYPDFNSMVGMGGTISTVLGCCIAIGLGHDILRQAQRAYHRAETFWTAAQEGMILLNAAGVVKEANPAYCRIVGREPESILGAKIADIFASGERGRIAATLQSAMAADAARSPQLVHSTLWDGREVWLEFSYSPLPGGSLFLSIVRDITERIVAQQRYMMIVNRTPIGIHFYSSDPVRGLVFTGANDAADEILGIAHRPLVGKAILEAFPSLEGTDIPASYRAVLETGKPFRRDEVFYSDDHITGAFEVVCFELTAGSIAVMFNNITERKRAEEALRSSEARYRLITDNSTDMISVHASDGTYRFASPSCRNLLGYEPEALVGRSAYDFFHDDDVAAIRAAHNEVRQASYAQSVTYRIRRIDGSWVWVETFSRAVAADGDSSAGQIIAVTRDVTERRNLEEQFHRSQRLESIGRLAGGVAHDFNNLLTVINGYAAVLGGDAGMTPRTREIAASILQAGERAAALTQHLLAFSRRQRLEPVVLNLNQVILDARKMLSQLLRDEIRIVLDLEQNPGAILADPTQLQQVLLNLTINAKDAISGAGSITISTREVEIPPAAPPGSVAGPGRYVVLSFADSGCGMTPEVRERIFEPFFTTKAPGQGTGLGLSTVFGIVQQSNGHITVDSEPGRGTVFQFFFPLVAEALSPPVAPQLACAARAGAELVLVVEDQPEVAAFIDAVLRQRGYRVLLAAHPLQALEMLAGASERPRIVLSDVLMPGLESREFMGRIRALCPELPVVLMSGREQPSFTEDYPWVSFVAKPFTPDGLLGALQARLG